MYAALWRALPGPWWIRTIILLLLAAGILYGLFFYVFPWVGALLNAEDVVVG